MKLMLKVSGLKEGAAALKEASRRFRPVVAKELRYFAQEGVQRLQDSVLNNELGLPPKRRNDGKPPLVDSRKYIEGYRVQAEGLQANIVATGQNDNMSNDALADVLEFEMNRPHLRPLAVWIERRIPILAQRIIDALFSKVK